MKSAVGDKWGIADVLDILAKPLIAEGHAIRAAGLLGAADALRKSIGIPLQPSSYSDFDRDVATLRDRLGEQAFEDAWADRRAMSLEQAIEYALTLTEGASAPAVLAEQPATDKPSDPLTPREREVAVLVARGLTDAQLAEGLVIGRRTAEKHVANCLGKLGSRPAPGSPPGQSSGAWWRRGPSDPNGHSGAQRYVARLCTSTPAYWPTVG